MVNTNNKKGVNRMKKQELINLGDVLASKGIRNTKKILNNYLLSCIKPFLYFLYSQ